MASSCRLLSGRGLLVTATVWLLTIGGALSEDDFICIPPNTSGSGPLMPTLPESYHIVYELNDLVENTSTFHNEWFDWKGQRAKVESNSDNIGTTVVSFFSENIVYSFLRPKPGMDEMEDLSEDELCRTMTPRNFSDIESPLPFYNPSEKPLRMVDIYQAFLFGGPYGYQFIGSKADEDSRYLTTNRFSSCVTDRISGIQLNITYHWTTDGEAPVMAKLQTRHSSEIFTIVRFERDPPMPDELFQIPRHMHCLDDPAEVLPEQFPALSTSFGWHEETIRYDLDSNANLIGSVIREERREVWMSRVANVARIDWIPTAKDESSFFDVYIGKPLKIVADIENNLMFIVDKTDGSCIIDPVSEDFPLVTRTGGSDDFRLKTPHELLGLTETHVNKSKVGLEYDERGNKVVVYSRLTNTDENDITLHEATLRYDTFMEIEGTDFVWAPVSQMSRKIISEGSNVIETVEQTSYFRFKSVLEEPDDLDRFVADECVGIRKTKSFRIGFEGKYADAILKQKTRFLNSVRLSLATVTQLSIMAIQKLDAYKDGQGLSVEFTLIDLPYDPDRGRGVLEGARAMIEAAIEDGEIRLSLADQDTGFEPLKGSLREIAYDVKTKTTPELLHRSVREVQKSYAVVDRGYSDATLFGVCGVLFVIGIVAGFCAITTRGCRKPSGDDVVLLGHMQEAATEIEEADPAQPSGSGLNRV